MAEHETQTISIEELESFPVDPQDRTKILKMGKGLSIDFKEKLEDFLCRNLDVFTWRHEDMQGINPKVSYHHLKINLKVVLHR